MTAEETIKLDNFKAHYGVILNNINQANDTLSSLLKKQEKLNEDIESLLASESVIAERLLSLKEEAERTEDEMKSREDSIIRGAEKLESERGSLLAEKQNFLIECEEKRKRLDDELSVIVIEIKEKAKALDIANTEIEKLNLTISNLSSSIKRHNDELDRISVRVTSETDKFNQMVSEFELRKTLIGQEIQSLIKQRQALEKELETPRAILDEREKDINRRERDIEVWTRRIQRKFKQAYPTRGELKI